MKEVRFEITDSKNRNSIVKQLKDWYGKELDICVRDNTVSVKGDLHNSKKRRKILYLLSGGKLGKNL